MIMDTSVCAVCAVLCIVLVVHACVLSCLMRAPAKTSPHKLQIHMHATSSGQEHSRTPQPQVSLRSASGQEYSHTSQDLTPHTSHLTPRTPQQTSHLAHLTRVLSHTSASGQPQVKSTRTPHKTSHLTPHTSHTLADLTPRSPHKSTRTPQPQVKSTLVHLSLIAPFTSNADTPSHLDLYCEHLQSSHAYDAEPETPHNSA